jgi:hypothetical protein
MFAEIAPLISAQKMVDQTSVSWNHIAQWLGLLAGLKRGLNDSSTGLRQ